MTDAPSVDPTPSAAETPLATDAGVGGAGPDGPGAWRQSGDAETVVSGAHGAGGGPGESDDGLAAHHALLGDGRPIVENLTGLDATPERFELWASPLALDADAAPARAVAVVD